MNNQVIQQLVLLLLNVTAATLRKQGNDKLGEQISLITATAAAGRGIDEHMRQVAEFLKAGGDPDLLEVLDRIKQHRSELHEGEVG